ncbi:MAG: VWA domain-containing protein [Chloracidobacterium sp.]|nr:VWA domain-containing protein [Chloracidobacterium sp.]
MSKTLHFLVVLVTAATLLFAVEAEAQSRRVPPGQSKAKINERTEVPRPTPTPAVEAEEAEGVISVDTRLVTVPVRVLDRRNRFIGGLQKEDFSIFENGIQQELAYFSNEAQPFTVALVLDMSYSSTFKIDEIQNAAIAFIAQLRPDDQVMVLSFDEEVRFLCEATTDRKKIYAAIRSTMIGTGTSLYEAVDRTMNGPLRTLQGRKAIVLFTDGVDTTSRRAHDLDNLRDAMELDALIYPIRYDTFDDVQAMKNRSVVGIPGGITLPDSGTQLPTGTGIPFPTTRRTPRTGSDPNRRDDPMGLPPTRPSIKAPGEQGTTIEEYRYAEEYLNQLAIRTGGTAYLASTYGNLNSAFAKIASELREFYSIGYYPGENSGGGTAVRIKVRVDRENVVVKARDSYVVPKK